MTQILEEQSKKAEPKADDEDEAILAFSNSMPGNDGEYKPPVPVSKEEIEKQKLAEQELTNLQTGDATAAFAQLATSEEIQAEVEKTGGSSGPVTLAQTGSASTSQSEQKNGQG